MKLKLSVLKLFLAYNCSVVTVLCSPYYDLSRSWVEKDERASHNSFAKDYTQTISNNLELITTTPLLDGALVRKIMKFT
jgi:hypothetical protein